MNGDYTFYITAAYIIAFVVLAGITITTLLGWKKVK
jgi:heme exporter protein CcmD